MLWLITVRTNVLVKLKTLKFVLYRQQHCEEANGQFVAHNRMKPPHSNND